MRKKEKAHSRGKRRRAAINGINETVSRLDDTTQNAPRQANVKIVLEDDIDFIRINPVYRYGNQIILHANRLRDFKRLPDNLTIFIEGDQIVDVIIEDQAAWEQRANRLRYKNMFRDRKIAYVELSQKAILAVLQGAK